MTPKAYFPAAFSLDATIQMQAEAKEGLGAIGQGAVDIGMGLFDVEVDMGVVQAEQTAGRRNAPERSRTGDIPASQTGTESGTAAPVELNSQDGQTARRVLTEPADPATINTQERIRWAIELRKAGAEPGEIFNKTNLIFDGDGEIQDGFGGKVVGRFDNGQKNMGELDSDFPVDAQKAPGDAQERVPGNEPRGVRTDGQRAYDIPAGEDKHRVILHDDLIARLPDGQLDKLYTYAVDIGDEVLLRQVDDEIRRRHNPVSGKKDASGRVYSPSEIERLRGISDNVLNDAHIRILYNLSHSISGGRHAFKRQQTEKNDRGGAPLL